MELTDLTQLRQLRNGFIAISEGTKPAVLVKDSDETAVFMCGMERPMTNAELSERAEHGWYPDFPSDLITICEANAVGFDNGIACCAGHTHFNNAEYYSEEEFEHALRNHHMLPTNARLA